MTDTVPALGDLLKDAPSNWGKWGPDDEVGALNYLGTAEVLAAASLIRTGSVFTLQRLIGDPKGDPVWPGRTPAERTQIMDESTWDGADAPAFPGGLHYADDKINAFLQGSTQYDALGHVWFDGQIWNGYDARSTVGGMDKASVEPIAQRGVVGRGVLLDMARFRGKDYLETAETYTHEDLLACAEKQGVELHKRDIIVIRTNYLQLFFELGDKFYDGFCEPGLVYSPELVQWFADMEIPNLVTDTIANEITDRSPQRDRARAAQRADAQPRHRLHRDRGPREAGRRLRRRRAVRVLLRCGADQGRPGQRRPGQPARDQVVVA